MKFLIQPLFCGALALLLTAGCSTAKSTDAADAKTPETKQEKPKDPPITDTRAAAERYMAGVEKAIRTRDLKPWMDVSPEEGKKKLTKKHFDTMLAALDQAGTFQKATYLGMMDNTIVQDFLWKLTFEMKEKDGSLRRTELLYLVRIYKAEDGFRFAGSGFKKL